MEHGLSLQLGNAGDLEWAQSISRSSHYLRRQVDSRARPMAYIVRHQGERRGMVMAGIPHATRCRGWWGYAGEPTQWQVVDICRVWIDPVLQWGGAWCKPGEAPGFVDRGGVWRPAAATWALRQVLGRIQQDRVRLWPPVLPAEPYHIELAISYHDPRFHRGTIYKECRALPMYTNGSGEPKPGPSGKFGWAWRLGRPGWEWQELSDIRPRTLRLLR